MWTCFSQDKFAIFTAIFYNYFQKKEDVKNTRQTKTQDISRYNNRI